MNTRYIIEATDEGYRLTVPAASAVVGAAPEGRTFGIAFEQEGGHGPLSELYGHAERAFEEARKEVQQRVEG